MAETARLADLNDEQYFTDLFTAARMEISSYKGFELWNQLESCYLSVVGFVPLLLCYFPQEKTLVGLL